MSEQYKGLMYILVEAGIIRKESSPSYAELLMTVKTLIEQKGLKVLVDRPDKLTNNIGCMSKSAIEGFADKVLRECGYSYTMKWTIAGNIVIKPFIYIDKSNIDQYPYLAKYWVLHEVAHIDTHPQDDRHGELFHSRLAELIEQFMGMGSYYG